MMIGYKMFARCCGQNYWNFIEFLFVFTFLVFFFTNMYICIYVYVNMYNNIYLFFLSHRFLDVKTHTCLYFNENYSRTILFIYVFI